MKLKSNNKNKRVEGSTDFQDEFRDFVYSRNKNSKEIAAKGKAKETQRPAGTKKLIYEVHRENKTTTFFVAEDKGDKILQLSQKEIRVAKEVIEDNFRPTHSIDGHAGTIVNSGPYRLDLQGYVNSCGTRWANVQLQYGMRKAGTSNTFAQVLIPTEDPVDYSHDVRLKALNLSLDHRVAVWVRTVPATPDELEGVPVRNDFVAAGRSGRSQAA